MVGEVVDDCPLDGVVAVDEDDWLDGVAVLWLDVESVELEVVLWLDDVVADGFCVVELCDDVVADGFCVVELWDDVLDPCAQAIAVANTATAALIKIFFIP